jgi:AraC-like DNA-binding protein
MQAWKPPVAGVREVFQAQFVDHAYPPHTHDTWTLFVVDDGVIRYDLDRRERATAPMEVAILPPHVVHDGRTATARGFRKRVAYLEAGLVGEDLIGHAVDRPVLPTRPLRAAVSRLHDALAVPDGALEAEVQLGIVVEGIRATLGREAAVVRPTSPVLASRLRELLDANLFVPFTMASAAAQLDAGATHLARSFSRFFGIAPHAYVLGRRMEAARERILRGQPLADVAAEIGFADQAHFTRRFRHYLGVPPGHYARAARR